MRSRLLFVNEVLCYSADFWSPMFGLTRIIYLFVPMEGKTYAMVLMCMFLRTICFGSFLISCGF